MYMDEIEKDHKQQLDKLQDEHNELVKKIEE